MRALRLPALASAAFVGIGCVLHSAPAVRAEANEGTLRVCLNEDLPPYSVRHGNDGAGFDYLIAEALAKRLGQRLAVQWFESKLDEDTSTRIEANALLSDGRCDLLGGYPLVKDELGKPGLETARLPGFAGAGAADRRRRVTLGTLAATKPYHFAALTVVLGGKEAAKPISSLADLDGVNVGSEAGTFADAILMSFDHGRLISRITHLVPGRGELLPKLEKGEYDATLIPLHRFDAYRIEHPDTGIKPSGYYFPIGFNMGFVGLATAAPLIERVNDALDEMLKSDEPASFASAAHMTYLPPRQPYILDDISVSDLTK
ncbi:MAG: substrate-binding periplasmic protein [Steroidobacteraceae bacterium]